jgi:hypothetical protein
MCVRRAEGARREIVALPGVRERHQCATDLADEVMER